MEGPAKGSGRISDYKERLRVVSDQSSVISRQKAVTSRQKAVISEFFDAMRYALCAMRWLRLR